MQYFKENPDFNNPNYNTKYGVYSRGCGLDNVLMSWGHDDYMYLVYSLLSSKREVICLFSQIYGNLSNFRECCRWLR